MRPVYSYFRQKAYLKIYTLMQKHMNFTDTPEPIIGRPKANAVTFKDHKVAPLADATATFTVDQATKSGAAPMRWQQVSFCLLSAPAAMP